MSMMGMDSSRSTRAFVENFESAHKESDVDFEPKSIHHTLGSSPLQAAPGNHRHAINIGGVEVYLGALPDGYAFLDGTTVFKVDYPKFFAAVGIDAASLVLPNQPGLATRLE